MTTLTTIDEILENGLTVHPTAAEYLWDKAFRIEFARRKARNDLTVAIRRAVDDAMEPKRPDLRLVG